MIKPRIAKINTFVFYGTFKRFEFMHGRNEIYWQIMLIDAKTLIKLMNSKELNLAKKIKKLMFSFQGIMVFYKMPAAILFIILLFSILKLGLFLPF